MITAGLRVDREELNAEGFGSFDPAAEAAEFERLSAKSGGDNPFFAFTRFNTTDFITEVSRITGEAPDQLVGSLSGIQRQSEFWTKDRGVDDFKVSNTNFSPSLAISWDPWSNGKNKFAASARRYYDKIILAIPLIENEPRHLTTLVFNAAGRPAHRRPLRFTNLRNNINPVDHDRGRWTAT